MASCTAEKFEGVFKEAANAYERSEEMVAMANSVIDAAKTAGMQARRAHRGQEAKERRDGSA